MQNQFVTSLQCLKCGKLYPADNRFTCQFCGDEGILDVQYDYDLIKPILSSQIAKRSYEMWRYRELLPIENSAKIPHLKIGWTPVYETEKLAQYIGIRKLYIKDDGRNPTSSFKDRASAVGVLKAIEFGFSKIACASTGNAASSLAGLSAAVGLQSYIFVPERAPEPKVTQLLIFGAIVFRVKGTYEQAFELSKESCKKFGWYSRNSGTNPYLVEGKKTAGLEIAEYFGKDIPDWVVVSVGDGCTIGGIGKGLQEMKKLGFIEKLPKLLGVQAEGAKPIYEAFKNNRELIPSDTNTIADSIAVGTPRNWLRAIKQIRASNGTMITVTDEEILEAIRLVARLAAVFGEPAGVAGVAGLIKAIQYDIIKPDETAIVVITGDGLKDIQSARVAAGQEYIIYPDIDSVSKMIR